MTDYQPIAPRWEAVQALPLHRADDPRHYHIEEHSPLRGAIRTALSLGMPLLLTGKPGVGKTQLAYRLAYDLGCEPIFFPVRSTSEAQDLFYYIDHLRRWHVARGMDQNSPSAVSTQSYDLIDIRRFMTFQGLGLAILRAMPPDLLQDRGLVKLAWPEGTSNTQRQPSVVLIDEIDKAPNDFTNDLLEAIRRLQFTVPELGPEPLSVYADPDQPQEDELRYRPVVIITSNSDKMLPEPFLRRCLYYHIEAPDAPTLEKILAHRIADYSALPTGLKNDALGFFLYLRDHNGLQKPPSTAELLNWFTVLGREQIALHDEHGQISSRWKELAAYCLLKLEEDQIRIDELIQDWRS